LASKGFIKCKITVWEAILKRQQKEIRPVRLHDCTINKRAVQVFDWGKHDEARYVVYVRFKDWWYYRDTPDYFELLVILARLKGKYGS